MKGLLQGEALCNRLFTLCLNPVAWRLRATEGYRLSKPIGVKVTDLLYINASESKLNRVLKESRGVMQDIGLHWSQKKGSVIHVKRAAQLLDESGMRMEETTTITALGEGKHYKFLGVLENVRQDERLALACAAEEYLRRISIMWSSPLSDYNRVQATNQYALPVLRYLMWTQHWTIREKGGRGLRSVEHEYQITIVVYYVGKITRLFFPKLRVYIKENNNSRHGKFHRFLLPFSGKFLDLNFAPFVLYIYSCYKTRT